MAIADVFTALTEDRPYREGMSRDRALGILRDMATGGALDGDIISVLEREIDEIDEAGTQNSSRNPGGVSSGAPRPGKPASSGAVPAHSRTPALPKQKQKPATARRLDSV